MRHSEEFSILARRFFQERPELMKTLMLLTFLITATNFVVAQPAARSSATAIRFISSKGLVTKADPSSSHAGPKVKNPQAAGRAGHAEVIILPQNRQQLKGPRYKNLKRSRWSGKRKAKKVTVLRKRLSGPRFKNRSVRTVPRQY